MTLCLYSGALVYYINLYMRMVIWELSSGGVDVRFFAALLSGMLGFTSKLQVLGIYTFSRESCIHRAHWGLHRHANWKTLEQGGLVLILGEPIRTVSDVSWHPWVVQRWTKHAQRYFRHNLSPRHISSWISTIFVQDVHQNSFEGDIMRKS